MFVIGKKATAVEVNPNAKHIIFLRADAVEFENFCSNPGMPFAAGTPVIPVHPNVEMDEFIRIYEIEE